MTNRLGAADEEENDISWECVACTLKNHPELPFCEACSSPKPISQPLTARDSPLRMDPASRSSDSVNRSTAIASGMNNVTTSSVTSSHSGESSSHSKCKYFRLVKEGSSSSDSSLSLSDTSTVPSDSCYANDSDDNEAISKDIEISLTGTGDENRVGDRDDVRTPICLQIRQRTPRDSITFRFYKNINRGSCVWLKRVF